MKQIKKLVVLICMLFFLNGCAAVLLGVGAGAGVGAYKWVEGRSVKEYPLNYSRSWDAVNSAFKNLKISVSESINEGNKGSIKAVRMDGTKVEITLTDRGQGVTSISIRVGLLGDRKAGERVHEEIASVAGIN